MVPVGGIPPLHLLAENLFARYPEGRLYVRARFRRIVEDKEPLYPVNEKSLIFSDRRLVRFVCDERAIPCKSLLILPSSLDRRLTIDELLKNYIQETCNNSLRELSHFEGKRISFLLMKYDYDFVIGSVSHKFSVDNGEKWRNTRKFIPHNEESSLRYDDNLPPEMVEAITDACGPRVDVDF